VSNVNDPQSSGLTVRPQPNRRVKRGWMNMRVERVIHETHDTDTFVLVDAEDGGRAFDYVAGQYLTFRFDDLAEKPIVRSYTMSSSPNQGDFSAFTVKRVDRGLVSNWLCDKVQVGTILRARGPIGKFCYEPAKDRKHIVMIAGGSGVTPFVSMVREHGPRLGQPGEPEKMTLIVSYRSREDLICWPDLVAAQVLPNVRVITTLSREAAAGGFWHGRIDHDLLTRAIGGVYGEATFMSCGPQAIMDLTVEHVKGANVPDEHVKTESFES
jgi:ferredoxin-NADP reductase